MLDCPCGQKIKIEMEYGVRVYKHKDGSYCELLNTFDPQIESYNGERALECLEAEDIESMAIHLYQLNAEHVFAFYEHFSTVSIKQLEKELSLIFNSKIAYKFKMWIGYELARVYNSDTVRLNIRNVTGGTVAISHNNSDKCKNTRTMPMLHAMRRSTIQDVANEAYEKASHKANSLRDTILQTYGSNNFQEKPINIDNKKPNILVDLSADFNEQISMQKCIESLENIIEKKALDAWPAVWM